MLVLTLGQAIGLSFVLGIILMVIYVRFIEPRYDNMPEDLRLTKEERERMKEMGFDTYEAHRDYINDLMGYKYLK
nr:MAG TPA: NICKEL AND COBALT RESISTANCE PROTEIN BINDING PROTEIN, SENSOR PROTEIN [Caudoviricetes sp.]